MPFAVGSGKKIIDWFESRGLELPPGFIDKAELYHDLIIGWSSRMNIVSKNDMEVLLDRHILDSLISLEHISDKGRLLDIGSGGGFPAIPLAMARPRLEVTLLESQHKKIIFLKAVCQKLNLTNIKIFEERLEQFDPQELYDYVTIRALPKWEGYLNRIFKIIRPDGKVIYYEKLGKVRIIKPDTAQK